MLANLVYRARAVAHSGNATESSADHVGAEHADHDTARVGLDADACLFKDRPANHLWLAAGDSVIEC
jgi:hypothetical protein